MTTFTLKEHDVPVTLPDGLSEDDVTNFPAFKSWLGRLTHSLSLQHKNKNHPFHADPYALRALTVQSHDRFGKRLGFLKLSATITNAAGAKLPGAVFLRGPSVAMLVMLLPDDVPESSRDDDEGERYVVLTVQPRVPTGSLALVELPAGMVEGGSFAGAAAREIEEELGVVIREDELRCLSDMARPAEEVEGAQKEGEGEEEEREDLPAGMFPSGGGCDEYISIYMHERRVPREQLKEWAGKLTGLRDEGEMITLKLVNMKDLWREGSRDAKCLAAVALWEGLRREGKL